MHSPKKLVIFDFDGTLVDSVRDVANSIAYATHTAGGLLLEQAPSLEEVLPHMGRSLEEMFTALLPTTQHSSIPACVNAYRNHYRKNCTQTTAPFPGILPLLTELGANGIRLAIASNKNQPVISYVVEQLGLTAYFDLVQGVDNFPGKPSPVMLHVVLKKLGLEATQAIMVGDTDNDVLAAQRAGVTVCAVGWGGAWTDEQLNELQPDFVAKTVLELQAILQELTLNVPV